MKSREFDIGQRDNLSNEFEPQQYSERETEVLEILDQKLLDYLHQAKIANSGHSGLIYRLEIGADLLEALGDEDSEIIDHIIGNPTALKLIKVSNPEIAQDEFAKQLLVWEAYDGLPEEEKSKHAAIPKPILYRTLHVDEDMMAHLNKQGAKLDKPVAAVVIMDWINGEDLQTLLYKKVLTKIHGPDYLKGQTYKIGHLHDMVARELSFPIPDGSLPDGQWQDFNMRNKIVMNFLGRKGETVPSSYVSQLKNTVALLNSRGLYHNDLHWRNVMVEHAQDGVISEDDKLFIIDFDTLSKVSSGFDDRLTANLLEELNGRNVGAGAENLKLLQEILPYKSKITRWKHFQEIESAHRNQSLGGVIEYLVNSAVDVQDMQLLCAGLWVLQDRDPGCTQEIETVTNQILSNRTNLPDPVRKVISLFALKKESAS